VRRYCFHALGYSGFDWIYFHRCFMARFPLQFIQTTLEENMQTKYSHNCLISCYQFVTEWDVRRNIDSIFIYHMHQFSDRQRPIAKLRRGVQEIKSWIVQALSLGEKFIYVELSNSSIQLWNVSRKPGLNKRNVTAVQLAADPLATATNKTVRKQKRLHRCRFYWIFSRTKLTVSSMRD